MSHSFLINQHGHYLVVQCEISIPKCIELQCTTYPIEQEMFAQLAADEGVSVEEFEGLAIHVRKTAGGFEMTDMCEQWHEIDLSGQTLEEYLAEYAL